MFIKSTVLNPREFFTKTEDNRILDFKKLNIFVGSNNSRKSRFLRFVFNQKFLDPDPALFEIFKKVLTEIYEEFELRYHSEDIVRRLKPVLGPDSGTNDYFETFNIFSDVIKQYYVEPQNFTSNQEVISSVRRKLDEYEIPEKIKPELEGIYRTYVPMLRGLRKIETNPEHKRDLYKDTTIRDYELKEENDSKTVFTGLELYEEIDSMVGGDYDERRLKEEFQEFLGSNFFRSNSFEITAHRKSEKIIVSLGRETDFPIHDVGDGVQSIILTTFRSFKYKNKNHILFIEEPEMAMHPYMQRVLIEKLMGPEFPNLQIFVTTHSNHFLDLTYDYEEDIKIFSFERRKEDGRTLISDKTSNTKILDLLGVRNSSVFLANCVIWTEGVTDRMLIKSLLELDEDFDFVEDRDYSFAEYGGANFKNFAFSEENSDKNSTNVLSYSNTNYIVADNDARANESKNEYRKNMKEILGQDNVFDDHVEIENLIPFSIWKKVLPKLISKKSCIEIREKEKVEESDFNEYLKTKKIGVLLKENFVKVKEDKEEPKYFKQDSVECLGVKKKDIMQAVINYIGENKNSIKTESFPDVAQNLLKSIKRFVKKANSPSEKIS